MRWAWSGPPLGRWCWRGEAADLAAAIYLAELERVVAGSGEQRGLRPYLLPMQPLLHKVKGLLMVAPTELPGVWGVPGGPESLVGAAEAILRLVAALAEQLGQPGAAVPGVGQRSQGLWEQELVAACCMAGVEAAAVLARFAAQNCSEQHPSGLPRAPLAGSGAAGSTVQHCGVSLAKAARALAALPWEQQAALAGVASYSARLPLLATMERLAWVARVMVGTGQQR